MKVIVPKIAFDEIEELGQELSDKIFALLRGIEREGMLKIPATKKKKLLPKGDETMKFFTLDEILEEKMKEPGFAERFERARQELEAEFAAERAHEELIRSLRLAATRHSLPTFTHARTKPKRPAFAVKLGKTAVV